MRNMSFMLTTEQIKNRTKTVTRRLGWRNAKPGDVVQPIVKGQGLQKGETVQKIGGPILGAVCDRYGARAGIAIGGVAAVLAAVWGRKVARRMASTASGDATEVGVLTPERVG